MKLVLNTSTKEGFIAIISSLGMDKVHAVFNIFLNSSAPIKMADFTQIMKLSETEAIDLANNKGELNADGELVGFLGFSIVPTNHRMTIAGENFYTWCAADTLIFPAILGIKAEVSSVDPVTNELVEVLVDQDSLISISPSGAMISWIDEVDDNDIRCSMCNRVHFFASVGSAKRWLGNNTEARIFTVTDFYATDISNTCGGQK